MGGGQVVSVFAFYSDDLIQFPLKSNIFVIKLLLKIIKKETGEGPFYKQCHRTGALV